MTTKKKPKSRSERDRTNRSLSDERGKTDAQLAKSRVSIEDRADAVMYEARERADDVLATASGRADEALRTSGASQEVREEVELERVKDRAALAHERKVADIKLSEERVLRQRAIVDLLRLEREGTDVSVLEERIHADEAIQSRDDVLAIVSHELRGLLGSIGLSAEFLHSHLRDATLPERVGRETARIRTLVTRMSHLVGDLVDVATIESGKLSIVREPVDPRTLVSETVRAFEAVADARGLSLDAHTADASETVSVDSGRILQVLANLVSNAIKFTPQGGRVSVWLEKADGQLRFAVRDSGTGIAPDHVEAIFRQFWQVNRDDRRGLGLGLFISRCIVEAHGGRIWVESRLGEGTTFFFALPMF